MSDPKTEVSAVVRGFEDAWNRHDMNAFGQLFATDAEFVNVVGLWWKGRTEIQKAHEFAHSKMFSNSRLTLVDIAIRFPAPNLAIARSRWSLQGHVGPEGQPLPGRTGILVNVLQNREAGWQIIDSQNTDIIEGALSRPQ